MKRVGRPPLDYDVKHVTINMKTEHYKRMRRDGSNMSRVINNYLDDLYAFSICPSCYGDEFEVRHCKQQGKGQRRECEPSAHWPYERCSVDEFNG